MPFKHWSNNEQGFHCYRATLYPHQINRRWGVVNRSLEELKKLWKQSTAAWVPTASLVESTWYIEHNLKISKWLNLLIMTTSMRIVDKFVWLHLSMKFDKETILVNHGLSRKFNYNST